MPDDQNEERAAIREALFQWSESLTRDDFEGDPRDLAQAAFHAAWQARGAYERARAQEMLGEIRACLDLLYSDRQYDVSRLAPELHKFAGPISIIDRLVNEALAASTSEGQG